MLPFRNLYLVFGLLICAQFAAAQTVVNSVFQNRFSQPPNYSDPNNWAPPEVPNNTATRLYNVDISPGYTVDVDLDATISNLKLGGAYSGLNIFGTTFNVTGTTTNQFQGGSINIQSNATAPGKFNAGALSTFSNHVLTGNYTIYSNGMPATLQFQDADVTTLSNGYFSLGGPLAAMVDQFGNDALRNLARIDSLASLGIFDRSLATNAPFLNEGALYVWQGPTLSTFTAAVSLTNFDAATRTITGGSFGISAFDPTGGVAELRFNGADIVNIASTIQLYGATARIADLAGNDGLRNLARILPAGQLVLYQRDMAIAGQFQNDGTLSVFSQSIFAVTGSLTNFDAATHTLSGGNFIVTDAQLKFAGADIVHNAAKLAISAGGAITDLAGNDALRNFSDNLGVGEFAIGSGTEFTASGDFTNAGKVETIRPSFSPRNFSLPGRFIVPSGFGYTQTGGATTNNGVLKADHVNILGGTFSNGGTVQGNVTVQNATLIPSAFSQIQGDLTLNSGSHFRYRLDFGDPREVTGKVVLAGTLEVDIPTERFVSSTDVFPILRSAFPLTGVFSNAPNGARIPTVDGKGSVVVFYDTKAVYVTQYHAEPPPAQLLNISARTFLSATNDDPFGDRAVLIGGFIISGTANKEIVLRGLGPSLAKFGLSPVLADPVLELRAANGDLIASNDDWKQAAGDIAGIGLAPNDDREAALRYSLNPGSYTVVIREKNGNAGHGLVEIYDIQQNIPSKLANISARGFTDATNLLVGGIIAAGDGQANAEVVVRALGPQLRRNGVFNALDDPTLEVRNGNGAIVAFNDDYITNFDEINPTGLAPSSSAESAVRVSLPRGSYTAIVRAKPNSGGVALVEFYDLRR